MFADALPALPGLSLSVLTIFTVMFAYLVFGMTGFGAALVAAPVLAHVMPLTSIVPLLALLDCTAALAGGLTLRGKIARRELVTILPFLILGNIAGAYLLFLIPPRPLMAALGATILGYASYSLFVAPARRRIARAWAMLFGSLGGMFGSMFGSGGFAFAIYLAHRLDERDAIRATQSALIGLSTLIRASVFLLAGVYADRTIIVLAAVLLPAMLLGLHLASRVTDSLRPAQFFRVLYSLLIASGAALIVRALHGAS